MNLTQINITLTVLLVIAAAFAASMNVDHEQPNVEFLPEMKRSAAAGSFSANAVLPHGRTLQPPVPGTIARGDLPLYYNATKEDAERAGVELQNPLSLEALTASMSPEPAPETTAAGAEADAATAPPQPDPQAEFNASVERGRRVYGIFCVSCHGPSGAGDGPVAKRGFPPPPPLPTGKSVQMKDGQLFHILTWGQGSMSPLAAQLRRPQRWDVINYVRSLQQAAQQSQPPADAAPADAAPAEADTTPTEAEPAEADPIEAPPADVPPADEPVESPAGDAAEPPASTDPGDQS